jgi:hypothetical protein
MVGIICKWCIRLKRYIAREVFTLIMRRQKEINQTRITA